MLFRHGKRVRRIQLAETLLAATSISDGADELTLLLHEAARLLLYLEHEVAGRWRLHHAARGYQMRATEQLHGEVLRRVTAVADAMVPACVSRLTLHWSWKRGHRAYCSVHTYLDAHPTGSNWLHLLPTWRHGRSALKPAARTHTDTQVTHTTQKHARPVAPPCPQMQIRNRVAERGESGCGVQATICDVHYNETRYW